MKTKTHKKFNISLPAELHKWCVKKQTEEQEKTPLGKIYLSSIVAKAVEEMMHKENADSRDQKKNAGAKTIKLSENFDSGPSIRMKTSSRKTG